jgi:hypothetical protein
MNRPGNTPPDAARKAQIRDEIRRDREARLAGYRARALKLFPHICARCCREFSGKRLPELTVHHKDQNHDNNPPDGSNWELLCIYCHDDQHAPGGLRATGGGEMPVAGSGASPICSPFEGLDKLLDGPDGR